MNEKDTILVIVKEKRKKEKLDILLYLEKYVRKNISLRYENLICEKEYPYISVIVDEVINDQEAILAYKCLIRFLLLPNYTIPDLRNGIGEDNVKTKRFLAKTINKNTLDEIIIELKKEKNAYNKFDGKGYKAIKKIFIVIGIVILIWRLLMLGSTVLIFAGILAGATLFTFVVICIVLLIILFAVVYVIYNWKNL